MILPIYIYGQPVLRQVAEDVELDKEKIDELLQNMYQTLDNSGGIGLAAPQIGRAERVVVIDLDVLKDNLPEYAGFRHAFINGEILEYSEETDTMEEGCLSLPGISEEVTRPIKIRVYWVDENMEEHEEWVGGYLARVIQHEFDHLEGKVFTDRISAFRRSMLKGKFSAFLKGKARCSYKVKTVKK